MRELSPGQRRVFDALGDRERTGTELAAELGRLQTNVCRDLRVLSARGLVQGRRDGMCVRYSVVKP